MHWAVESQQMYNVRQSQGKRERCTQPSLSLRVSSLCFNVLSLWTTRVWCFSIETCLHLGCQFSCSRGEGFFCFFFVFVVYFFVVYLMFVENTRSCIPHQSMGNVISYLLILMNPSCDMKATLLIRIENY